MFFGWILSIILGIFFLLIFVSFFIFWSKEKKTNGIKDTGKAIFQLDLKNRKIFLYDTFNYKIKNKEIFKIVRHNQFIKLSKFTSHFQNTKGEALIRNMFLKLSQGSNKESISFQMKKPGRQKSFNYNFLIIKMQTQNVYTLVVSWNQIYEDIKHQLIDKQISKFQIIDNSNSFKGFVAFNLDVYVVKAQFHFFDILINFFKKQNIFFYHYRGMLVVVFFSKNFKQLQKNIDFFINKIKKFGYTQGLHNFYYGSGIVKHQNLNTSQQFNTIFKRITYLINVSIKTKKDFVEVKHVVTTKKEQKIYKKYLDVFQTFKQALKTKDIQIKTIPIKSYTSQRIVINYAFPTINKILNKDMSFILENKYNKNLLMNAHADMISQTKMKIFPILFDVYGTWLEENIDKIIFEKVVYIISSNYFKDLHCVSKMISTLLSKGFVFAIRLKNFNENIALWIKKLKPQFIVVDSQISKMKPAHTYLKLLSIKKLANALDIKVIHENPVFYDQEQAFKIGLKYYYNF